MGWKYRVGFSGRWFDNDAFLLRSCIGLEPVETSSVPNKAESLPMG